MKKLIFFLISLCITIPCIAQSQEVNLNSTQAATDCNGLDCLKDTAPEYQDWVDWGKPDCWCCKRHCRGDINCAMFFGKPVTLSDLAVFKAAFNKTDAELALISKGICADFNHAGFFGKRVTLADLIVFKNYFNKPVMDVPCCDLDGDCILGPGDKYNCWTD